jgi:hypothetical protein
MNEYFYIEKCMNSCDRPLNNDRDIQDARDLEAERDIEEEYEMAINQVELENHQQDLLIDELMSQ